VRPLLLLDVDGPLSPWAACADARPAGFVEHRFRLKGWSRRKPLRMWLNPAHGPALVGLGMELVWATSWGHQANTLMGPALGLPTLPVIEFPAGLEPLPGRPFAWKYGPVARFAAGRPLAWLDDDFGVYPAARKAFLERRGAAGLATTLVEVDPAVGITDAQLAMLARWRRSQAGGPAAMR
jgi:hypothetical protein